MSKTSEFRLKTDFEPRGDQPEAIRSLVHGLRTGKDHQVLLGVTGSGKSQHMAASGNGPVNALDKALRKALTEYYPELKEVKLVDYKVRVLSSGHGTAANVRVLIESSDGTNNWCTVGVSEDVIEASYQALVDSIEYKLLRERGE